MTLLVIVATFVAMEPATYAAHRWIMHGSPGIAWHESHHASTPAIWERNDWYPVVFASAGLLTFVAGATVGALEVLIPVSLGGAAYGVAYGFVHDVYIHRRLGWFTAEWAWCERLKGAHRIHHLWGGEPFGMLVPIVPAELRRRAAAVGYDPFPAATGRSAAAGSSGSRPVQVPVEP